MVRRAIHAPVLHHGDLANTIFRESGMTENPKALAMARRIADARAAIAAMQGEGK